MTASKHPTRCTCPACEQKRRSLAWSGPHPVVVVPPPVQQASPSKHRAVSSKHQLTARDRQKAGVTRASKLTPTQRQAIARTAAAARWQKAGGGS